MHIAVIGGGLQGVEICILAQKAKWTITLIDQQNNALAKNFADNFYCLNIENLTKNSQELTIIKKIFHTVDIIIPALENDNALKALVTICNTYEIPLAFDAKAYSITSSKLCSRDFFEKCQTPIPLPAITQQKINFPLIAKPSCGSGSQGVRFLSNEKELYEYLPQGLNTPNWIIESYCSGSQFSMEICGTPGNYKTFALTELLMDNVFDCRAVRTPFLKKNIFLDIEKLVKKEIIKLAENLCLHGIMDIEVVQTEEGIKVFEIDARFPSQTPLAVYLSTGINLLEHYIACFVDYSPISKNTITKFAYYYHIAKQNGKIIFPGEHSLTQYGSLKQIHCIPETVETIIGGNLNDNNWSAVLLLQANSADNLEEKCKIAINFLSQK